MHPSPPSARRELRAALFAGSLVIGLLVALAALLWQSQEEASSAEHRRFAERAEIAATLTQSVFSALGVSSGDDLRRRFQSDPAALGERLERQLSRSPGLGYLAVTDGSGRVLAGAGELPSRLALANVAVGGPLLSDVQRRGHMSYVEYAIPFGRPGARRVFIQGVGLKALTTFLDGYLDRLSRVDGAGFELRDGNGVVLTRRGLAAPAAQDRVTTTASVPGTGWRLRLEARRSQALGATGLIRWLPWLLFGALALATVAALRLYVRMRRAARRRRRALAALNESRDQSRTLVEALEEGVFLHHEDGTTELLNASARELVDSDGDVLFGLAPGWKLLDSDGNPYETGEAPIERALRSASPERDLVGLERPDGSRRWFTVRARPLFHAHAERPHAVVASCSDVTAQRELELSLRELAHRDALTGLWNRRRFEEDVAHQLARCRRYGERAALLLIDIDHFKHVNDTLGHLAGDDVLRALGDALTQRLRASDSAGRFGGDEFAVLLLDAGEEEARELTERVRRRVARFAAEQLDITAELSLSVGVTVIGAETPGVEAALEAADAAMYADKRRFTSARRERAGSEHRSAVARPVQPSSLRALMTAVQARDSYTGGHSREVVTLVRAVARRLGLDGEEMEKAENAALLHDLGKIAIPDAILRKPGPLDEQEELLMRQHPVVGAQMAATIPELEHLAPAIRAEHERWDGRGYPDGLAGEQIPIASRITFVCDAYHAMTSNRPYRRALSREAALTELEAKAGSQFCPAAARELLEVLRSREEDGSEPVAAGATP